MYEIQRNPFNPRVPMVERGPLGHPLGPPIQRDTIGQPNGVVIRRDTIGQPVVPLKSIGRGPIRDPQQLIQQIRNPLM